MAAICSCGKANPDGAKFCLECGAPISRSCGSCGVALPPDAKFCLECGSPVGGVPEARGRREMRKVVTIVFVDLAGSTSLQEHMDPESVRRVMERFYATMRAKVEAAGGVVVKFTGDGVMAGFGIREAREDDALRAVRAAVAMQESFGAFAKEIREGRGADVSLRVGINTGEVVVSETDDDVVGDVVNVAARLEHAAGDGNILVGDETWKLTRHDATFEAVAPLELKGKAEPVPAYRVVSLEAPAEEGGIATPFVGRAAELRRFHEVFERSSSTRSPSVVTVVGSPGLGKSRLASEFVSSVSDRAKVLEARCEAAGTATYAPIAEAFRQAAGIAETAAKDEVLASLEALIPDGFPERGRLATLVASLLGIGEPTTPEETFWAVRRLLEGLAATQPLVLVVDDVQWAEPMLLDLLDHIVEWAKDAAILIVALARPEIREVRPSLLDAGAIVLEGLDPADTAELAQGLLGAHDLPASLVRRILATTQGNPLFVRELLRMLVDDGVLHRDGERWVVSVNAEEIDVPPTIHALLSARIERLREDERAVVERASVVGQEFYRGAVMELVPAPVRGGVDAHLETLRRKELVEPEGSYWIDERVFRFHHVLIRDAAYRRLLKEARAELHERFADWLEAKVGDLVGEHEEVLGYHLEQACTYRTELGTLDEHADGLGPRASAHLASATRRALDRDDLAAAANLSGRALALTEDDGVRASILLHRCEALLAMGDVGAAAEAVSELRLRASDDRLGAWADCFDGQLAILTDPARLRETGELVEGAARRLAELKDSAGAAKGHAVHAQALAHLGQFGACEAALDRALAAAREAGDRRRANAVLSSAPLAALWGPSPVPRASGRCLDVVRVLRITAGAPAVEATALRCQAVLEAMRGRSDAARRMLASARATLEELGLRHALVECDMFAGLIDLLSGDPAGAEANLRSAYEGFRTLNVGTDTAQAAALLARALIEQGRDDEALVLTEESERLGGDDLKTAIAWRCVRARVLARRGRADAATEIARAAVALAETTDALIDHADARLALAEVLLSAGMYDEARTESRRGAELYARKEATTVQSTPVRTGAEPAVGEPAVQQSVGGVREAPWIDADLSMWERVRGAVISCDWQALAALLTSDFDYVDHRSGLRSELSGRDAFVDAARSMWQDIEQDWEIDVIAAWSRDIVLSRLRIFGEGWERIQLAVTVDRDGACCRLEHFDQDDYEAALERLDELTYEVSIAKPAIEQYLSSPNEQGWTEIVPVAAPGNAALVRVDGSLAVVETAEGRVTSVELFDNDDELGARKRLHQLAPSPSFVNWLVRHHFDRHAHQDWIALRALNAPDVLVVDRRPVGWGTFSGVERMLEHLQEGARTASMAPGELWITEWLAIAPDRALFRYRWAGTAPDGVDFDFQRLLLMRVRTGDGLIVRSYMYNPDQIDDARRFMAGPDVPIRAAPGVEADLSLYERARTATLDRDREAMLALFTHDHVYMDHRAGLQGEVVGPVELLDGSAKTYQGLEFGRRIEVLSQWTDDVSLARSTSWGDGFEITSLVVRVVRDGAWCRTEQFDPDDFESAFTRLDELAYDLSRAKPLLERYESTYNERDWDGLRAVFVDGLVVVDHRSPGLLEAADADSWVEVLKGGLIAAPDLLGRVTPIAASGSAALIHALNAGHATEGGGEVVVESLALIDTAEGRITRVELFDADDEFGARSRLHELAPSPSHPRWGAQQYVDAHNAQDWDGIRRLQEPTFVLDDRRPLGWERTGVDGMIEHFQEGIRSTTSLKVEIRDWICLTPTTSSYVLSWDGVTKEGAAFDYPRIVVYTCGPSGLGTRSVVFELDQMEEARRLLVQGSIASGSHPVVAAVQRIVELGRDGDWAGVADLVSADVIYEDHRPLFRASTRGRDALVEAVRYQLRDGGGLDIDVIEERGSDLVLVQVLKRLGEGGGSEIPLLIIYGLDDSGRLSRCHLFAEDELEAARECFGAIALPSHPVGAAFDKVARGYNAADPDTAADAYASDLMYVDHVHGETLDHAACVEAIRRIVESTVGNEVTWEPIVWLGSRHGVLRATWRWDRIEGRSGWSQLGPGQNTWALAVRVDQEGRICVAEQFVPELMHKALARAEELYIEDEAGGEAAAGSRRRLQLWRMVDAHNEDDFDGLSRSLAPGIVFVDRRQLGWGTIQGRADVMDVFRAVRYRSQRHVWSITDVHAIADNGCVYTHPFEGVDQDGGRYEGGRVVVAMLSDDGITRLELFSLDAVTEAIRRFEELREDRRRPSQTIGEWFERFRKRLLAGDHEGYAALCAEDFVSDDRRPTLRARATGRQVMIDNFAHVKDLTRMRLDSELIATRGDHLEVRWTRYVGEDTEGGAFDVPLLVVNELNEDGLLLKEWVGYEPEDLQAALTELDDRYAATLPPGEAEVLAALARAGRAYSAHDWDGFASAFHEDVIVADHRPAGWATVHGVDDLMSHALGLVELVPDSSVVFTTIDRVNERGVLATLRVGGTDTNGGAIELTSCSLHVYSDGRFSRWELFPLEERDAAIAQFKKQTRDVVTTDTQGGPTNGYTRMYDRWLNAVRLRDWETVKALQSPDIVLQDRRAGLQHVLVGREEALRTQREGLKLDYGLGDIEVVATRGDRLALQRIVWTVQHDSETEWLLVGEMDDQGRMSAGIVFEPDELKTALEELDSRYGATLPPSLADTWRFVAELTGAYNNHDWERFFALYDAQVSVVDHRPAWFGRPAPDDFSALLRGLVEVVPDVTVSNRTIDAITDDGVSATVCFTGTDMHGNPVEIACAVTWVRRNGKVTHWELFPLEDRDAAIARLQELTGPQTTMRRTWHRLIAAFNERDVGELRELFASDVRVRDHSFHFELGRDGILANFEVILADGSVVSSPGWAIYLGDRHAVGCMTYSGSAGASGEIKVVNCNVARCDADGRYLVIESYAETDVIRALERAEELYLEDEATGDEAAWSRDRLRIWRSFLAFNEGDVSPFREWLQPEIVTIDHRPASLGELRGRDAWLSWLDQLTEVAPDRRWQVKSVQRERDVILLDMLTTGTNRDGGPFEIPLLVVTIVGGDRQEFFSPEQRAKAEHRFRELAREPRAGAVREPSTHIERTWDRLIAALNDRDVDVLRELHAPGFRQLQATWHIEVDLDEIITRLDEVYAPPARTTRGRGLVLGDRHGVMEMIWRRPAGGTVGESENVIWIVFRFDEHGKILRTELFSSEEDFLLALERLEELYREDEAHGDDARWSEQRSGIWRTLRALNEGADPADLAERFRREVVMIDRRPAGFGELRGNEAWVSWHNELIDGTGERRWEVRSVRLELNVLWLEMAITGTNESGGRIEIPFIRITRLGRGQSELFAPEQREEAEQRFRELLQESVQSPPTGSSTTLERTYDRWYVALNKRDFGTIADLIAPGFRCLEHPYHLERDRDEELANIEYGMSGRGSFFVGRCVFLGDRHGMHEMTWRGAGQRVGVTEKTSWYVNRSDSDGRLLVTEMFTEPEFVQALERLERLYLEDEATGDEAVWSRRRINLWRYALAYNSDDWAGVRSGLDPDLVVLDHRPAGWGRLAGRDVYLDTIRGLADMVRDRRWVVRSVKLAGSSVSLDVDVLGSDEQGGNFVLSYIVVVELGDGGVTQLDQYAPEQRDEAERRFGVLADTAREKEGGYPATTMARAWDRLLAAWNSRDIGAVGELLAPDYRCYEHTHHLEMDRDAVLADTERTGEVPGSVRSERAFFFGDRHGLVDFTWTGQADGSFGESKVTVWHARRSDSDGRFVAVEVFAEDQFLEALARIEELYLEDEADGGEAEASRHRLALWRAFIADNQRDWETWKSATQDFVTVDRRPLGHGTSGKDTFLKGLEALDTLSGEWHLDVWPVEIDGDAVLLGINRSGTNEEGGRYEYALWSIVAGGKYQEWFAEDQRAEAEDRFRELAEAARAGDLPHQRTTIPPTA